MKKHTLLLTALALMLLLACAAALFFGTVSLNFLKMSPVDFQIFYALRLPRVLLAALVGAMLAVSGCIFQGVLKNPLSDPYILGVASGAGLGAAIGILIYAPMYAIALSAFVGALISVFVVYNIARSQGVVRPENLILAGVAVSSFVSAILALLISSSSRLQSVYFWMLGSFSYAQMKEVWLLTGIAAICILLAWLFARQLNIMSLGEEEAMSLGIDTGKFRIFFLVIAALMTAAATAFCGIVGFVGLIVPHIFRMRLGANNYFLIPACAIGGAILTVCADLAARTLISPAEIPVGIVTALIGAPYFIWILKKQG